MYVYTCKCASMYRCMHVCMYVREDFYVYIGIRYTCIYVCTIQLYLYIKIYIYMAISDIRARTERFDLRIRRYDSGYDSRRRKPSYQHWPGIEP